MAAAIPKPPARRLASIKHAAEYADASTDTIERLIKRGIVTGYRIGPRLLRVDLNELDAALRPVAFDSATTLPKS